MVGERTRLSRVRITICKWDLEIPLQRNVHETLAAASSWIANYFLRKLYFDSTQIQVYLCLASRTSLQRGNFLKKNFGRTFIGYFETGNFRVYLLFYDCDFPIKARVGVTSFNLSTVFLIIRSLICLTCFWVFKRTKMQRPILFIASTHFTKFRNSTLKKFAVRRFE